jgi:hypothetical protein
VNLRLFEAVFERVSKPIENPPVTRHALEGGWFGAGEGTARPENNYSMRGHEMASTYFANDNESVC